MSPGCPSTSLIPTASATFSMASYSMAAGAGGRRWSLDQVRKYNMLYASMLLCVHDQYGGGSGLWEQSCLWLQSWSMSWLRTLSVWSTCTGTTAAPPASTRGTARRTLVRWSWSAYPLDFICSWWPFVLHFWLVPHSSPALGGISMDSCGMDCHIRGGWWVVVSDYNSVHLYL